MDSRTRLNITPPPPSACCGGGCSAPAPAAEVPQAPVVPDSTTFRIPTMDCPVEEGEIRRALEPVAGIQGLRFQLGARTLAIRAAPEVIPAALAAIRAAGFAPQPLGSAPAPHAHTEGDHAHDHDHGHDHSHGDHDHGASTGVKRLALALLFALGAESLHLFFGDAPALKWAGLAVAAVAIWLAGVETYTKGFAALRRGRLNINALMTVAVTGAFVIGQWPEAAMVMALYAIAELIEARAADRARNAIEGLLALAPEEAEVQQPDGTWTRMASTAVPLEAVVRISPGERVPLDGVVTTGSSTIDQSPVTGESLPVDKAAGDVVFAGTINQAGELAFRVTAAASNTTLARIIHAVEEAQSTRAPTQRFVDRFAAVYTPTVFAIAVAVAVLAPTLMGIGWLDAVYKALVLLVVACPCALVISTPVTIVSALASGARRGILIKGGAYLESARSLKVVALDKTGTITSGKPTLVHQEVLRPEEGLDAPAIAASLAGRSDHPVSLAIAGGLPGERLAVDGFTALPGRGVEGVVGATRYTLANHRLVKERALGSPELEARLAAQEALGRTVSLLADDRSSPCSPWPTRSSRVHATPLPTCWPWASCP